MVDGNALGLDSDGARVASIQLQVLDICSVTGEETDRRNIIYLMHAMSPNYKKAVILQS